MDSEEGSTEVHLNNNNNDTNPCRSGAPPSIQTSTSTSKWHCFGYTFPRREVVYLCQALLVYIVILACLANLSLGHSESNIWIALLSSCLGYMLPQPSMGEDGSFLHHPT